MNKRLMIQKQKLSKGLKSSWMTLWEQSSTAHFFNSVEWFELSDLFSSDACEVFTVSEGERLVAVLPISLQSWFGVITQTCPAGRFMDKLSLLYEDNNTRALKALVKFLKMDGNFYLAEISEHEKNIIVKYFSDIKFRFSDINYYLPLTENPWQFISKKNLSKIKNKIKKNRDELSFKSFYGDVSALKTAFAIDMKSYKQAKGMASFTSKENQKIFMKICKKLPNFFRIDILYFQKKPVAYSIGFICRQTYLAINTSFDNEFRNLTPGKLLTYMLIERLVSEKFSTLDFGRGDSWLKKDFTSFYRKQYLVYYHHSSVARLWWQTANLTYDSLLNSKIAYGAYRKVKRL